LENWPVKLATKTAAAAIVVAAAAAAVVVRHETSVHA